MNQDQVSNTSPFSALSYQEQQDRWLEWRSRQLDYKPVQPEQPIQKEPPVQRPEESRPRLREPNMRIAAPIRRRELDEVLSRHRQAMKRAGTFQTTSIG